MVDHDGATSSASAPKPRRRRAPLPRWLLAAVAATLIAAACSGSEPSGDGVILASEIGPTAAGDGPDGGADGDDGPSSLQVATTAGAGQPSEDAGDPAAPASSDQADPSSTSSSTATSSNTTASSTASSGGSSSTSRAGGGSTSPPPTATTATTGGSSTSESPTTAATTPTTAATTPTTASTASTTTPTTTATTSATTTPPGVHPDIVRVIDVPGRNPGGIGWADSYSVGDQCYCASTFDHGVGDLTADTPAGTKTVREICDRIGDGPGLDGRPIYNDIQCGNGPANDAGDEDDCPGRVDIGRDGCGHIGPRWDLTVFG